MTIQPNFNPTPDVLGEIDALVLVDIFKKLTPFFGELVAAQLALSAHESLLRSRLMHAQGRKVSNDEVKAVLKLILDFEKSETN